WFFTTVGRTATSLAAPPPPWLEKAGSGVSVTPPRTRAAGPATRHAVASRQKTRRDVMEEPDPDASGLRGCARGGWARWSAGGGRITDGVQLADQHRGAEDVERRRDHPPRAVAEVGESTPGRVHGERSVFVQLRGPRGADGHGPSRGHGEHRPAPEHTTPRTD